MNLHQTMLKEYEQFLRDYSTWVLYLRLDRRFPCLQCWHEETRQSDPECTLCFGFGYHFDLQRIPTRIVHNPMQTRTQGEVSIAPGFMSIYPAQIYTARNVYPKQNDFVFEVEWDTAWSQIGLRGHPTRLAQSWELHVLSNQQTGPITFWEAAMEVYEYEHDRLQAHLDRGHAIKTIYPETWKI